MLAVAKLWKILSVGGGLAAVHNVCAARKNLSVGGGLAAVHNVCAARKNLSV